MERQKINATVRVAKKHHAFCERRFQSKTIAETARNTPLRCDVDFLHHGAIVKKSAISACFFCFEQRRIGPR